ncbi:MAG: helix-turn-helix domain-containing protein [Lentisphaerae bacterium]|nr:helix-turn-helix domain-containing protein [Lentisphaerota bacterium]
MALGEKLRNTRLKRNLTASQVAAGTRMKVQMVEDLEREDFSRIAAPIYGRGFIKMYANYIGLDPAPLIEEYISRTTGQKPPSLQAGSASFSPRPLDKPVKKTTVPPETEETPVESEPDLFSLPEPPAETEPDSDPERVPSRRIDVAAYVQRVKAFLAWVHDASGVAWRAGVTGTRKGWETVKQKVVAIKSFRPNIKISRTPLTLVSIGLAVLIVLVFIGSCLSRYVGDGDSSTGTPVRGPDQGLSIESEPPDLYLDEPVGAQDRPR